MQHGGGTVQLLGEETFCKGPDLVPGTAYHGECCCWWAWRRKKLCQALSLYQHGIQLGPVFWGYG